MLTDVTDSPPERIEVPREVVETLTGFHAPLVISHVVPDADALGSMFSIARALNRDGCRPRVSLPPGSLSKRLAFMFDWAEVTPASEAEFGEADGFVVLDTAKKPRCNVPRDLKGTEFSSGRKLVNIDHHTTNTMFGDLNWVVGHAGSTCELLLPLLMDADLPIDEVTASMLYAGIMTDTCGFSLPTTTSSSLHTASRLAALGARIGELGERLSRSQSRAEFDLLRVIYANTRTVEGGRLAYSTASHAEIAKAGCTAADIDDQVDVPRSLDGAMMAILFTEGHAGRTRINFRGTGPVAVVELAGEFGGGGHSHAAGAVLDGTVEEVVKRVLPRAESYLRERLPA